jgi:hypothetical protein
MSEQPTHVRLPIEAIPDLRRMLLIGLHCFGEVERLTDNADTFKAVGHRVDAEMVPTHPTGAHETTEFANALRWLEHAEEIEE